MHNVIYFLCRISNLDSYIKGVPEYYNSDSNLPILERITLSRNCVYTIEDIIRILLHPNLHSSQFICTNVPVSICESISLVIDLDQLDDKNDVLADDMGVWNNGVDTSYICVSSSEYKVERVKKCDHQNKNAYTVKRVYHTHSTDASRVWYAIYIVDMSMYLNFLVLVINTLITF